MRTADTTVSAVATLTHKMDPHNGDGPGKCATMTPAARMQQMTVAVMHAMTGDLLVSPSVGWLFLHHVTEPHHDDDDTELQDSEDPAV